MDEEETVDTIIIISADMLSCTHDSIRNSSNIVSISLNKHKNEL